MTEPNPSRLWILCIHYVRSPESIPFPGIHPVSLSDLGARIDRLSEFCHLASPEEVAEWLQGGSLPGPSVFLTFDDGLIDHAQAAREVLEPRGIRAGFFIPTAPLEEERPIAVNMIQWLRAHTPPTEFRRRVTEGLPGSLRSFLEAPSPEYRARASASCAFDTPEDALLKFTLNSTCPDDVLYELAVSLLQDHQLTPASFSELLYLRVDQVRELHANGHRIGCHGHHHQPVSRLNRPEDIQTEVQRPCQLLQSWTGAPVSWMAYPWGSPWALPTDTEAFCREAGLAAGMTYLPGPNSNPSEFHCLRRLDIKQSDDVGRTT